MKACHKPGDSLSLEFEVKQKDTATFESGMVHPVYATFALARDAEWTCRQFVLHMKEEDEEGIGTFVDVQHISPALLGSKVCISACLRSLKGHEIICDYEAKVGERLIARGSQGQKILKKEKLERLFGGLK